MHVKSAMYITLLLTVVSAPTVSAVCHSSLCLIESLRLKRQIRSSGPTTNPSSPCPLTRVTQCHECPYKAPALSLTPNRNPCRVAISEPPAPNGVDVHSLSPRSAFSFCLPELIPTFWCLHLRPWVVERTPSPIKSFFGEEDEGVN